MSMTEEQLDRDWFSKPGDAVLSQMRRRDVSPNALAEVLKGGLGAVRGLLAGQRPIDDETAATLERIVGGTAAFWLKRQANYERDLERALRLISEDEVEEWLKRVPAPGERPRGRLNEERQRAEVRRRLVFFNVSNIRVWNKRYGHLRSETQFRTSPTFLSDDGAMSMWLRQGELDSAMVATKPWNPVLLRARLGEIRKLSRIRHPHLFIPKLKQLCAGAGAALVVARTPKGCRASGASRLLTSDKAMVLLSFRFLSDDHFWFTLFHELGHLLLHGAQTFIDDEKTHLDEREKEANLFASTQIIPPSHQADFERLRPDAKSVLRFSVSVGVSPGLIVGQMQHREMVTGDRLNYLKRRWRWDEIAAALAA